jgi:gluconolactonase
VALSPAIAAAQTTPNTPGTGPLGPVNPPTTTTSPPRDFTAPSVYFSDPDALTIDSNFSGFQGNSTIARLWTGPVNGKPILWAEGPAWSSQGQYLLFSDIPNSRQLRWLEDDGHISVFRQPTGNSNGNTFDAEGRQISFEHGNRRVVRYDHDGGVTVLAESYQGKRLNSPNDGAVRPDGSIWFTDPPWGGQLYEGDVDKPGGPSNPDGKINARAGQPAGFPMFTRELPTNVYRIDPNGTVDMMISADQILYPNGLCFSPDYKQVYVVGNTSPTNGGNIFVGDVAADGKSVSNVHVLTDAVVDGVKCGSDGLRCDVDGNIWSSSNAGRNVGYSGVTVWDPSGKLLGRLRLPEVIGNITFGGPKRNRLFMAGSTSLYAYFTATQGAGLG